MFSFPFNYWICSQKTKNMHLECTSMLQMSDVTRQNWIALVIIFTHICGLASLIINEVIYFCHAARLWHRHGAGIFQDIVWVLVHVCLAPVIGRMLLCLAQREEDKRRPSEMGLGRITHTHTHIYWACHTQTS